MRLGSNSRSVGGAFVIVCPVGMNPQLPLLLLHNCPGARNTGIAFP